MRECGLKYRENKADVRSNRVTPRAGVWIEICLTRLTVAAPASLPVRECGLKYFGGVGALLLGPVTPRAGVWIEIP